MLRKNNFKCEIKVLDWYERKTSFVLVMEKPQNSIDLFEFSRNFGAVKEQPAKIIFRQVNKNYQLRRCYLGQ